MCGISLPIDYDLCDFLKIEKNKYTTEFYGLDVFMDYIIRVRHNSLDRVINGDDSDCNSNILIKDKRVRKLIKYLKENNLYDEFAELVKTKFIDKKVMKSNTYQPSIKFYRSFLRYFKQVDTPVSQALLRDFRVPVELLTTEKDSVRTTEYKQEKPIPRKKLEELGYTEETFINECGKYKDFFLLPDPFVN